MNNIKSHRYMVGRPDSAKAEAHLGGRGGGEGELVVVGAAVVVVGAAVVVMGAGVGGGGLQAKTAQ